jgi:hypothetical protein
MTTGGGQLPLTFDPPKRAKAKRRRTPRTTRLTTAPDPIWAAAFHVLEAEAIEAERRYGHKLPELGRFLGQAPRFYIEIHKPEPSSNRTLTLGTFFEPRA